MHRSDEEMGTVMPTDLDAGGKNYYAAIEKIRSKDGQALSDFLENRHDEGQFVLDLSNHPDHYGNRTVANVAKDLGQAEETVRCCRRFAEEVTKDQLKARYIKGGFGWTILSRTLTIGDKKERERLEDRARKESWSTRRVEEEVKEFHRVERAKNVTPKKKKEVEEEDGDALTGITHFKATESYIDELTVKLDDCLPYLSAHRKRSQGPVKRNEHKQLDGLLKKLVRLIKHADKVAKEIEKA